MSYLSDQQCDILSAFRLYDYAVKYIVISQQSLNFNPKDREEQISKLVDVDIGLKDVLHAIGGSKYPLSDAKDDVAESVSLKEFGFENIGDVRFKHGNQGIPVDFDARMNYWEREGKA